MLQMATNTQSEPSDRRERMTIREAADFCHVDYDTVLKWVNCGVLKHHVVGPHNIKRVYRRDVELLIRHVS